MLTIVLIILVLLFLNALMSGELGAIIGSGLLLGIVYFGGTSYNSGKAWLYNNFSTPNTRIQLPTHFTTDMFGSTLPYCSYLTTTTGPEGVVIEDHTHQPFVVNTILHICLPQGTEWANDPWITQLEQYSGVWR